MTQPSSSSLTVVDCSGLMCPQPVVRTRQAIAKLAAGDELEVIATDPMAELDLAVFCQRGGHELLSVKRRDDRLRIRIRVSPAPPEAAG